jgi:hypothetical protein
MSDLLPFLILILWFGSAVAILIFIDRLRRKGKFRNLRNFITNLTPRPSLSTKKTMFVLLCFMVSGTGFYAYYTYQPLSDRDLYTVSGPMKNYEFRDYGRKVQVARIELMNYSNTFQISNTSDKVFNRRGFERHDRRGKTLTLKIKSEDAKRLVQPGKKTTPDMKIWVYELTAGDESFMTLKSYVDYESKDKRIYAAILALVFLILGLGILLFYEPNAETT